MKNSKSKLKIKKFIKIIIVCIVVLVVLIFVLKQIDKNKPLVYPEKPTTDPKTDEQLNLSGFGVFFEKYTGELKSSEIAAKLEKIFTEQLPEIYNTTKKYNEAQLKSYYAKDNVRLKRSFGMYNSQKFSNFISKLKNINEDLNTWYRLDVLKDTFVDTSDKEGYAYVECEMAYQSEQRIRFSLYVAHDENKVPLFIIDVIEN